MKSQTTQNRFTNRQDRIGKRQISAFVENGVYWDFKRLAAEQCATTDGMVAKAVALLFEHYKKEVPTALRKKLNSLGLDVVAIAVITSCLASA